MPVYAPLAPRALARPGGPPARPGRAAPAPRTPSLARPAASDTAAASASTSSDGDIREQAHRRGE